MTKLQQLKLTNTVLAILLLTQAFTGIIMFFEITFSNVQVLYDMHEYNGLVLVVLVVVHFILNWNWVKVNFLSKKKK